MKSKRKNTRAAIESRASRELADFKVKSQQEKERSEMRIIVSRHAVAQYRKKMFEPDITDEEATKILTAIARRGQIVHLRPTKKDPRVSTVFEFRYRDLSIVAEVTGDMIVIATFLGDRRYRAWAKTKEIALRYA
ncbi:MAG: hypothetical protein GX825_07900 [Syntrophomonadaceae bacterium]|nr:hypothetical protein [Syntrophomonadaceae bacterium]